MTVMVLPLFMWTNPAAPVTDTYKPPAHCVPAILIAPETEIFAPFAMVSFLKLVGAGGVVLKLVGFVVAGVVLSTV